jgi:hypothetical protein
MSNAIELNGVTVGDVVGIKDGKLIVSIMGAEFELDFEEAGEIIQVGSSVDVLNKLPPGVLEPYADSESGDGDFWADLSKSIQDTAIMAAYTAQVDGRKIIGTAAEVLNPLSDSLVLRFGPEAYDSSRRLDDLSETRRIFDDPLQALLSGYDIRPDIVPPTDINGEPFYYTPGLTVIIARSASGKTTLIRNLAIELLSRKGGTRPEISFIPWNEREMYSNLGDKTDLVQLIESSISQGADIFFLDALRDQIVGGPGPSGVRGMNTSFLMNLTQWHHAFADRNVCGIAVINPILADSDFTDVISEILRGAINGLMIMNAPGSATYEHMNNNRRAVKMKIPLEGFVPGQLQLPKHMSKGNAQPVDLPAVDFDPEAYQENFLVRDPSKGR